MRRPNSRATSLATVDGASLIALRQNRDVDVPLWFAGDRRWRGVVLDRAPP